MMNMKRIFYSYKLINAEYEKSENSRFNELLECFLMYVVSFYLSNSLDKDTTFYQFKISYVNIMSGIVYTLCNIG